MVAVTLLTGFVVALLMPPRPSEYRATAVVRLAGERRELTGHLDDRPPIAADRGVDPLLSLTQILTSRSLVGTVVDSLDLQLRPIRQSSGLRVLLPSPEPLPVNLLADIQVDSNARPRSVSLSFLADTVIARDGGPKVAVPYGKPVQFAGVRFTVLGAPKAPTAKLVVAPRDRAIDRVLGRLKVVVRPGTNVAEVKLTDADPVQAQRVANLLVQNFQALTSRSARELAKRQREFLDQQLQRTNGMLARAEANLSAFRSKRRVANAADRLVAEQAALLALDTRRSEMEADRRVYQAVLAQIESANPKEREDGLRALAYTPEIATDQNIGRLHQRLVGYQSRLDSLTTGPWRSLPNNPDVAQLTALVESVQRELVAALRTRVRALDARGEAMVTQRQRGADSMRALSVQQTEEAQLDRQVELLRTTVDHLREEYEKASMAEAINVGDVEVMDLAPLPYRPIGVPRWLALALGLGLGFFFSSLLAILLERTNRSIRRPEELLTALGTPSLAVIPRLPSPGALGQRVRTLLRPGTRALPSGGAPDASLAAESFRMLGIGLRFGWQDGPKMVMVTSAAPQEGKTLVAANLAAIHAREGLRVLLVDGDIRRPRLHKLFRLPRTPGLMDLVRTHTFGNGVVHTDAVEQLFSGIRGTGQERLFVLPCGQVPAEPSELLRSSVLQHALRALVTRFDLLILDTAPLLVSADAAILAPLADAVVLVVSAGQTPREAVALANQQLATAGAHTVGAVLNDRAGVVGQYSKAYYGYTYPAVVD